MQATARIRIDAVVKRFDGDSTDDEPVLGGVSLDIEENEFVVLLGRSGCGKTTLLNIVAGLEQASAGQVLVDGNRVTRPGDGKGMVFQQGALFPWLTASQNVRFAARKRGLGGRRRCWSRPNCWIWSDSRTRATSIRLSSRAVCSSGSQSRVRWRSIRRSC